MPASAASAPIQQPAGASIGRALRLLSRTWAELFPAVARWRSVGAMRYTNVVFAEAKTGCPKAGAARHRAPRFERARTRCRSYSAPASPMSAPQVRARKRPEEDVLQPLAHGDYMRTTQRRALDGYEKGNARIMIVPRIGRADDGGAGWTKPKLREFLGENSKIPLEHLKRAACCRVFEIDSNPITREKREAGSVADRARSPTTSCSSSRAGRTRHTRTGSRVPGRACSGA